MSHPRPRIQLYKLPRRLERVVIHARPSSYNKSPYLIDIQLADGSIETCHNPALGCNGLVTSGAVAYVMPAAADSKAISKYTLYHIELAATTDQPADVVCVHPAVANEVAAGLIDQLLRFPNYRREVTCGDCRFDFAAETADGRQVYLEVKNASIADTVNCLPCDRRAALKAAGPNAPMTAIFPYGNKPKAGLVSPRALKHAEGLAKVCRRAGPASAYIIYMSQRPDVECFKISALDPEYRAAVTAAAEAGVIIQAYSIRWIGRRAYLRKALPINL